jgi:alanine-glyoxylate transaminase/serine-glyoxylate transaminase/serine-pyruvate transaminase
VPVGDPSPRAANTPPPLPPPPRVRRRPTAAKVVQLKAEAGRTFSVEELKAAVAEHRPAALFLVQGESSTGAHQVGKGGKGGEGERDACARRGRAHAVPAAPSRPRPPQALGSGLGDACRAAGALLIVDTVAALGGVPFLGDAWGVDAAYTGSQARMGGAQG